MVDSLSKPKFQPQLATSSRREQASFSILKTHPEAASNFELLDELGLFRLMYSLETNTCICVQFKDKKSYVRE
jgi:hypothetical protein